MPAGAVSFTVNFTGNGSCGSFMQTTSTSCSGAGTGTLDPFGRAFVNISVNLSIAPAATSSGQLQFDFGAGSFTVPFTVTGVTSAGSSITLTLSGAISGGTGVMSGAAGTLSATLGGPGGTTFTLAGSGNVTAPGIANTPGPSPSAGTAAGLGDTSTIGGISCAAPVTVSNGNMFHQFVDLAVPTHGPPLWIIRTYNSQAGAFGPFGPGWTHNYQEYLKETSAGVTYVSSDGAAFTFAAGSAGYAPAAGLSLTLTKDAGGFLLHSKTGLDRRFDVSGNLSSLTDSNGNRQQLTYDAKNRITRISDSFGASLAFQYDAQGRILGIQDQAGRTAGYGYDAAGNLQFSEDPAGARTQYTYTAIPANLHLLASAAFPGGGVMQWNYDTSQRVSSIRRPGGAITSFTYGNNQTMVTGERGFTAAFQFAGAGVTRITAPDGSHRDFTRDANGNLLSAVDELGFLTQSAYDPKSNLIQQTDALGNSVRFTYDPVWNKMASFTDAAGNQTRYTYDKSGNLAQIVDALGGTSTFTYDAAGNLITATDPDGAQVSFTYDTQGNPVQKRDAMGNITRATYDNLKRLVGLTDPLGRQSAWQYDKLHRLAKFTNPAGETATYAYDAAGNLVTQTTTGGQTITFQYDARRNLAQVKDPLGKTSFYDYTADSCRCTIAGLPRGILDPNGKSWGFAFDFNERITAARDPLGNSALYGYDARGNLLTYTDANGNASQFQYDALGRLVQAQWADGAIESFTYDANGNLLTASNGAVTLTYTYDALDRVTSVSDSRLSAPLLYTYSKAGKVQTMTDPDGGVTTYEYDANGRPTRLVNPKGQPSTFLYDAASQRVGLAIGGVLQAAITRDSRGRVSALAYAGPNSTVLASSSYTYDHDGNILSKTGPDGMHSYQYDALHRPVAAMHPDSTSETYSYDAAGNRTESGQTYDDSYELLNSGVASFTYDNNGNTITRSDASGTTSYAYDSRNRLVSMTLPDGSPVTYTYDPLGRRIEKNVAGTLTRYVYDGDNVLLEQDAAGATTARYTHGPAADEPLILERGGQSYFYLRDGLGSVVALTDTAGNPLQSYSYDSFGNAQSAGPPVVANPFQFASREFDSESGLYFNRARHYDPSTGRFLQRDPIGYPYLLAAARGGGESARAAARLLSAALHNPPLIHPYVYALNNPVSLRDPSGMNPAPAATSGGGNYFQFLAQVVTLLRAADVAGSGAVNDVTIGPADSLGAGSVVFGGGEQVSTGTAAFAGAGSGLPGDDTAWMNLLGEAGVSTANATRLVALFNQLMNSGFSSGAASTSTGSSTINPGAAGACVEQASLQVIVESLTADANSALQHARALFGAHDPQDTILAQRIMKQAEVFLMISKMLDALHTANLAVIRTLTQ